MQPAKRPVAMTLCLMLACVGVAVVCTATAHASGNYPMLLCAGGNGSGGYQIATNTISANNPACGRAGRP